MLMTVTFPLKEPKLYSFTCANCEALHLTSSDELQSRLVMGCVDHEHDWSTATPVAKPLSDWPR